MRIGIFGGTFDPIHIGHLVLAERAREEAALDRILFLPALIPPHKQDNRISDGKHRLEMLEIAIAGNEHFAADDVELKRTGVSYTIETLREISAQNPGAELFLIVGSDTLADIPTWRAPEAIIRMATLVVGTRPGASMSDSPIPGARVVWLAMPQLDISSTDLRDRVRTGRSIRYLVPAGVEAYIAAHGLYATGPSARSAT